MKYILSLDIGTTSTRAAIFSQTMEKVVQESATLEVHAFETGDVEQDAVEIWQKTLECARKAIKKLGAARPNITCLGITNQRETVVAWNAQTGKPQMPAIVWQDRRTADACKKLERNRFTSRRIRALTGLVIDPSFSATKIAWMQRKLGSRALADTLFGTIDAWIIWNLTCGRTFATDVSNASRTMLMSIEDCAWNSELLGLFRIDQTRLPHILPSDGDFGTTDARVLGMEIPIRGVLGDQQAALFAQGPIARNELALTYGTGIFALKPIGTKPKPAASGILTTVAWKRDSHKPEYAYETSALTGGVLLEWLKQEMGLVQHIEELNTLAASVDTTGGVTIVPAFAGLAAPDWDPLARGLIIGINRATKKAHLARAALEAIACQTLRMAKLLEAQTGESFMHWKVGGGLTKSKPLMQSQADIAAATIHISPHPESTAAGAAIMAGLACKLWPSWRAAVASAKEHGTAVRPKRSERGQAYFRQFERAVQRAKDWARK